MPTAMSSHGNQLIRASRPSTDVVPSAGSAAVATWSTVTTPAGTVLGGATSTSPASTRVSRLPGVTVAVNGRLRISRDPGRATRRIAVEVSATGHPAGRSQARDGGAGRMQDPRLNRRCHRQCTLRCGRGQWSQMLVVPTGCGRGGQLRATDAGVRRQHVTDLLPRVVHVLLGVALDDVGAEAGGTRKRGSRLSRCTQLAVFGAGVPSRSVSSRWVRLCHRP